MIGEWNYFEPRQLHPALDVMVVACRINKDKSLDYWEVCPTNGVKPLHIPFKEAEE